jgi:hypothetical protein
MESLGLKATQSISRRYISPSVDVGEVLEKTADLAVAVISMGQSLSDVRHELVNFGFLDCAFW